MTTRTRGLQTFTTAAAFVFLLARLAGAQNSQFIFDAPGNLLTQTSETTALPQILGQPQSQIVMPGEAAGFSVVVANTRGLGYHWFFNGTPIPGATNDALPLTNVSITNEGQYFVTVSNASGFVASDLAMLFIDADGDSLPDSWEQTFFSNLDQTATGDFDGDGVSNLQEFLDGTNPTNSASALYRITLLNDGGTVVAVPDQPTYTNGASVTLTATASGPEPFHAWTGDVVTRINLITLTMTNNKTLFAHFHPIVFVWTSASSGDWNGASNWTPNLVPGSNDSAAIVTGVTVTLNSDADCADFTFGAGNASPTLTGSGALTIRGTCSWLSGDFSGSGRTVIEAGGTLAIANPSFVTITTRTLENGGMAFWTGAGGINLNGAVITNRAGALFEVQSAASFNFAGGVPRFDNAGTFRKSAGGTTVFNNVSFNNYDSAQIQNGALSLSGGGLNSGSMEVPAGTTLSLSGGTFTGSASSSITGAGQFTVNGATATLAGLVNVSGTNTFSSGTANLTGNYVCTNNTMILSGGVANFDGTGVVTPAVVNLSNGTLGGGQTVTVGSAMSWTGGNMSDSGRTVIPAGSTLAIANPSVVTITTRTLDNGGTTLWTGAATISLNGAVITNRAGALFEAQNAASCSFGGGVPRFDNAGTFRKSLGGTTAFSTVSFNNYNSAQLQSGTLSLNGGGLNNGTMDIPAGTTLLLGAGTFTASAGSSLTGAGNLTFSGATATLAGLVNVSGTNTFSIGVANLTGNYICTNNTLVISGGTANFDGTGAVNPAVLNLSNGTLGGGQTVTVGSAMSWTGGNMAGSGRTFIPPGSTLTIANPSFVNIITHTLDNGGTTLWPGTGNINLNGAVITNRVGALFNPQNAASISFGGGSPRFDNAGTYRKSVGTGTATIGGSVPFTNYGTVDIQSGFLAANGGYASSSNAVLSCAIGGASAGTGYGQLQAAGTLTLNGALSVGLTKGYLPAAGDSFTVVTAGTRNGTFTSFYYPSNTVTMQLSDTTNSVVVLVDAVLVVPQPILLSPTLSGSNLLFTWSAVSNTLYRVEFTPDLTPSNWNPLPGDVTGVSNTASKQDTLTPSNRFYRVRVLP